MIKAVIFDLYGVLIANSWQEFKHAYFTIGSPEWQTMVELGRCVDAGTAEYETFVDYISDYTGESQDAVRGHLEHNVANEQLLEYVELKLKPHYKLGVLSNASTRLSNEILSANQAALFDAVILSRDVGHVKPDPQMYLAIAEKLEVMPTECLYVDDQALYVEGANAVGMTGVVYRDDDQVIRTLEKIQ